MELNKYWDYLILKGIATEDELQLVTNILGYKKETLDSILYARTGFNSIDQLID